MTASNAEGSAVLLGQALEFFSRLYRGKHHIPSDIRQDGSRSFSVRHDVGQAGLSTFDHDDLTRLVFLAHELGWRAAIFSSRPRSVRIVITKRSYGHVMAYSHPTLDEAVTKFKERDWERWPRVLEEKRLAQLPAEVPNG